MPNTVQEVYDIRVKGRNDIVWDAGADILDESDYSAITKAVLGPAAHSVFVNDFYLTLKARFLIYSKNGNTAPQFRNGQIVDLGDCATASGINLSSLQNESIAFKAAALGGKVASQIYVAAAADPEPVTKAIIAGIGLAVSFIGGFFARHHAQAVAREQTDICAGSVRINYLLQQVDQDFLSGKVSASDAGQALANIRAAFEQAVAGVQTGATLASTGGIKSKCNAACATVSYLDGLIYMRNNYLYPRQAPNPITSTINNAASTVSKAIAANPGKSLGIGAVVVGLLALLALKGKKVLA